MHANRPLAINDKDFLNITEVFRLILNQHLRMQAIWAGYYTEPRMIDPKGLMVDCVGKLYAFNVFKMYIQLLQVKKHLNILKNYHLKEKA